MDKGLRDEKLDMSWQCAVAAQRQLYSGPHQKEANRVGEVFLPTYSAFRSSHVEYCIQLWGPQHKEDVDPLEKVQKSTTKMIRARKISPMQKDRELSSFGLHKRRLGGDLIESFQHLKWAYNKHRGRLHKSLVERWLDTGKGCPELWVPHT